MIPYIFLHVPVMCCSLPLLGCSQLVQVLKLINLQVHCEVISDLTFLTQGVVACLALVAAYHTLHGCLTFVTALCNKFILLVHIFNVKYLLCL